MRSINMLKVRGSWGRVGNDRINPSEFVTLLSTGLSAVFGNQIVMGSTIAEIKDPNIKWETTEEIDLGIDFEAINGHISGVIDFYNKKTLGALFNIPLPVDWPMPMPTTKPKPPTTAKSITRIARPIRDSITATRISAGGLRRPTTIPVTVRIRPTTTSV